MIMHYQLYARAGTCEKHLHDPKSHKIILTLPLFIEVPMPSQNYELSYTCVLSGINFDYGSMIFRLDFKRTIPTVWHFLFFINQNVKDG